MKYSFVIAALVGAMSQADLAEATAVANHHHHQHQAYVQDEDKAEEGKDVEQSKKEAAAVAEIKKGKFIYNRIVKLKAPKEKKADKAAAAKEEADAQAKGEAVERKAAEDAKKA